MGYAARGLMLWVLLTTEIILSVVLLVSKRCFTTPCLFGYTLFSIISAITFNPSNVPFFGIMAAASDFLKGTVLLEVFLLLTSRLDKTDRLLSAAIGILAAALVTASAYDLPNKMGGHMLTLVWMASFALAVLWWTWRRGERLEGWVVENACVLALYLTVKAAAVVIWGFTKEWRWGLINDASTGLLAICFVLWVYAGPRADKKEQVAGSEGDPKRDNGYGNRSHRLT